MGGWDVEEREEACLRLRKRVCVASYKPWLLLCICVYGVYTHSAGVCEKRIIKKKLGGGREG